VDPHSLAYNAAIHALRGHPGPLIPGVNYDVRGQPGDPTALGGNTDSQHSPGIPPYPGPGVLPGETTGAPFDTSVRPPAPGFGGGSSDTSGGNAIPNPQLQIGNQEKTLPSVNEHFADRLAQLQSAVHSAGGQIYPFSVGRSPQEQDELYRRAIQKYGDEKVARQYVSPRGQSRHEHDAGLRYGLGPGSVAADLRGDLAIASRLAAMYGLEFNDKNNPWHVTMAGLK
jgi:D-alanyl-D-alanine carboxypeptidase